MASPLPTIAPPAGPVFRIARGLDPFEAPAWVWVGVDGTFGGRFDDPERRRGLPGGACFRMLYCATQRAGAFGETMARFRPSLALLAALAAIDDDEPLAAELRHPIIAADWRAKRRVGVTVLDPTLRFIDIDDAATIQHLRLTLASVAGALGLPDVDVSTLMSQRREFTQAVARYLYEQADSAGRPLYAGIRYVSRLNSAWELWAVYDTRLRHRPEPSQPIHPDDPDLLAVAHLFGLRIEGLHGRIITP